MTKYILGIIDGAEEKANARCCEAAANEPQEFDELTWREAADAIDRLRLAVHHVFGFEEHCIEPVRIGCAGYPLTDSAFECKGYSYEVRDGELTCVGKVAR